MTRQAAAYRERRILLAGVNVSPSFRSPTKDNGEKRWPWRCEVRPRIIINRVQRSPAPNLMSGPERDLSKSVQQQSNIELEDKEYARGLRALEDVFDAVQGDRLYPWPMLQTRLTSRLS